MKPVKGIAVFVFSGLCAGLGVARDAPSRGKNEWEIGPEIYRYDYEEPGLMQYDGALFGLGVRFTRVARPTESPPPDEAAGAAPTRKARPVRWAFRAEGRYAAGATDYDGQLMDGTPYSIRNVDATSWEGRALFGLSFPKPKAVTTLFLGLGHRFKDDDSSFDPASYARESTYLYMPAAFEHIRPLAGDRTLSFTAGYDVFLSGDQESDLSALGVGKLTNRQSSGWGARAAIAYSGVWGRHGWTIEPFIRHWNIAQSEYVDVYAPHDNDRHTFVEPKNTTTEIGVSARMRF